MTHGEECLTAANKPSKTQINCTLMDYYMAKRRPQVFTLPQITLHLQKCGINIFITLQGPYADRRCPPHSVGGS